LAFNTFVISSVVDTDLHHYVGDEWLSNFCQIMAIVSCDLMHVFSIFAVLRLAFDFALIYSERKNR
jgi:K+-transporting ATPase A subunit